MRTSLIAGILLSLLCTTITARADGAKRSGAPPGSEGFQLALRTGYALPMGNATGNSSGAKSDDLSGYFGGNGQVPLILDIGGKPTTHFFIGGYFGVGVGGAGDSGSGFCSESGASCTSTSARIGAQVIYSFMPDARANPWLGYGFGYESISLKYKANGQEYGEGFSGLEFGHFMFGIDFRITSGFGVGPFFDLAVGRYSTYRSSMYTAESSSSGSNDIPGKATHEWVIIGPRFVLFP